jgi:hypothetical protein
MPAGILGNEAALRFGRQRAVVTAPCAELNSHCFSIWAIST